MNIDIIAVNIVVTALIFGPYLLFIYVGQQDFRKINELFKIEAKNHALKIDIKDRWNLNAIGIDSDQQKLLFVQRRNDEFFVDHICLKTIQKCEILHHSEHQYVRGAKELVLQKVELSLYPFNSEEKIIISLFNSDLNLGQDYEVKNAEKWNKLINNALLHNSNLRRVA